MRKYTKVSDSCYVDHSRQCLVAGHDLKQPNTVYCPPIVNRPVKGTVGSFEFKGLNIVEHKNYIEDTDTILLNQIKIKFNFEDASDVDLSFYDFRKKQKFFVNISTEYRAMNKKLVLVSHDFDVSTYKTQYTGNNIDFVAGCKHIKVAYEEGKSKLIWKSNIGLINSQFKIAFRGIEFGGASYVYLNDAWGILLNDDLSIDAIFTIGAVKGNRIDMANIIWSTNPYIAKVVLRGK